MIERPAREDVGNGGEQRDNCFPSRFSMREGVLRAGPRQGGAAPDVRAPGAQASEDVAQPDGRIYCCSVGRSCAGRISPADRCLLSLINSLRSFRPRGNGPVGSFRV
jgi:hypothetical protein